MPSSDEKNPPAEAAKTAPAASQITAQALSFPIVGIGASAGGLAAFEAFFSGMPADVDTGMAFVLVQHLAPDHKSLLTDLVRRYTRMQVFEVEDGVVVQPNCTYIIPPGRDMAFLNGALHLFEPSAPRGLRLPVDFFFRSLAQDQKERAIGIVLSGTGSDGTMGVRAIKGEGGMVMAQTPASTEYDGMPRRAIATGLVDYELLPAEMPAQLISYGEHAFGKLPRLQAVSAPTSENSMKKIFILLRAQTGHDFSQYKQNTVHRRIERRMAVHQIDSLDTFVKYLQQTPAEVDALFRDLLIGVTNFFRDPEAFQALETLVIPKIFEGKPPGAVVRVWVAACSTGEEAYSIGILLMECMEALKQRYALQIFATDIDSQAIATARAGLYPASIASDISPERLARFFAAEPGGGTYRLNKNLRDCVIFSEQDVIKDPPFSKIDLISCRNLLIYMGAELQQRLIPLFHYAMNPGGVLFLGTSEGIGDADDLFAVVDRKAKIYRRKEDTLGLRRAALGKILPSLTPLDVGGPRANTERRAPRKVSLREIAERTLISGIAPAGALVDAQGDILYLHGRTGMFLEPAPGDAGVANILSMARDGLRHDLTMTLQKAIGTKEMACAPNVRVKTNGHFTFVEVTVMPVANGPGASLESPLYMVALREASPARPDAVPPSVPAPVGTRPATSPDIDAQLTVLKTELRDKEEYLRSTLEELQSSGEELKSANEEMQSVNEELQSTNEELETSKEELQSLNEELATVNNELQTKVVDLSRANNDMNNLLSGTGIGTVFVDHQLRILRFTPAVCAIINLIPSDVGRPVAHIVSNLVGYSALVPDVQAVLDTLVPKEVEVRAVDGKSYKMRIQPYRTQENVIEGAVMSFIDITDMVHARDVLSKANESLRLAVVARDARDAVTVQDLDGRILVWNPGAERLYGWTETEALLMNTRERIPPGLRETETAKLAELSRADSLQPHLTQRLTKQGAPVAVSIISTALLNDSGQLYAIATTERAKTGGRG